VKRSCQRSRDFRRAVASTNCRPTTCTAPDYWRPCVLEYWTQSEADGRGRAYWKSSHLDAFFEAVL
jgi:hypothetical protein